MPKKMVLTPGVLRAISERNSAWYLNSLQDVCASVRYVEEMRIIARCRPTFPSHHQVAIKYAATSLQQQF